MIRKSIEKETGKLTEVQTRAVARVTLNALFHRFHDFIFVFCC